MPHFSELPQPAGAVRISVWAILRSDVVTGPANRRKHLRTHASLCQVYQLEHGLAKVALRRTTSFQDGTVRASLEQPSCGSIVRSWKTRMPMSSEALRIAIKLTALRQVLWLVCASEREARVWPLGVGRTVCDMEVASEPPWMGSRRVRPAPNGHARGSGRSTTQNPLKPLRASRLSASEALYSPPPWKPAASIAAPETALYRTSSPSPRPPGSR